MAGLEYRGINLRIAQDGADGTLANPYTVVRGLAIERSDGTWAEVSDENPIPISLSPVPMGNPVIETIIPPGSIELIPAPTNQAQSIHLYGIVLSFTPAYVTGEEIFEATIYAFKSGQPDIEKMSLPGIETFDGFSHPVEIEPGYSLRLKVPSTVEVDSVEVHCSLQYRYGYPGGSEEVSGGSATWGEITGVLADQVDLEDRFSAREADLVILENRLDNLDPIIETLETQVSVLDSDLSTFGDRLGNAEASIEILSDADTVLNSAIILKQDQLTDGIASTYNSITKTVDIRYDNKTIILADNKISVAYTPQPKIKGFSFSPTVSSEILYNPITTAPTNKILQVDISATNPTASSIQFRIAFKSSAGVETAYIYTRNITANTLYIFPSLFVQNGESIGLNALASGGTFNVLSKIVEDGGTCQTAPIGISPSILSETITSGSYKNIFLTILNTSSGSAVLNSIELLDSGGGLLGSLAPTTTISSRSFANYIRVLTVGQRLRCSAGVDGSLFANLYAIEGSGW